jgi:hypothetical protein
MKRSGLKLKLISPVFRAQIHQQADMDMQFLERITPLAQTDPEVGMALNKHGGMMAIAAKMDVSPELFVSSEEFNNRVGALRQQEAQAQAMETMREGAQAYQAAARGTSSLQDMGQVSALQSLVERGGI